MYNRKFFVVKEELKYLYIDKKMSRQQIADKYGVHEDTIYYWLIKYKIPLRTVGRPKFSRLINID